MGFNEDMEQLRRAMKQLEIEYEQWFSGALPRPPVESKKRVEEIIRRYNVKGPPNLGDAAVFQMHQSKYQSYNEMWNRRVRLKEEGRLPTGKEVHRATPREAEPATEPRAAAPDEKYRRVFEEFVAARQKAGQGTQSLSFENFRQLLTKQADQLRTKGGYRDVDFGVTVKDGKASVVARPKR